MNKLASKEIKGLLKIVETELNKYDEYDLQAYENGGLELYTYKLLLNKNKDIECRIYPYKNDCCEYVIKIPKDDILDSKGLLKGLINYIYENEINTRRQFIKANKSWYNRKHKSLCTWVERCNKTKINDIVEQIASRYSITKDLERKITYFKQFVTDFYNCISRINPIWKLEDVMEKVIARAEYLNIDNVTCVINEFEFLTINRNGEEIKVCVEDCFNISETVNYIISRIRR